MALRTTSLDFGSLGGMRETRHFSVNERNRNKLENDALVVLMTVALLATVASISALLTVTGVAEGK
jgi:hypothetical protein